MLHNINNGCQAQTILFLLATNVLFASGGAVMFTIMAVESCSRVFQGACGAAFVFLFNSIALLSSSKAWKQLFLTLIFILNIFVFVIFIVTAVYSVDEQFCSYAICVVNLSELDFYYWFNNYGIRQTITVSCYEDQSTIEEAVLEKVRMFSDDDAYLNGSQFSILYGWPLSFGGLLALLSGFTLVINYRGIFSCRNCSISKSDFTKQYFSFSDDDEEDDNDND